MFVNDPNIRYMEIMKKLAQEQKLYIIIADSDYIYGTNYQFCHGFVGKGLTNMTQQKTIQSMGRIGRNNIQQEYNLCIKNPFTNFINSLRCNAAAVIFQKHLKKLDLKIKDKIKGKPFQIRYEPRNSIFQS
jgi:putative heme iron utilization protein